jgi:hypothetical protein
MGDFSAPSRVLYTYVCTYVCMYTRPKIIVNSPASYAHACFQEAINSRRIHRVHYRTDSGLVDVFLLIVNTSMAIGCHNRQAVRLIDTAFSVTVAECGEVVPVDADRFLRSVRVTTLVYVRSFRLPQIDLVTFI